MAKKKKTAGTRAGRSRRGKGESNTEAKANAVEVRTAISQDDLKLPAPDDYQHHKKSILGALEKKTTADGFYRNCLKKAKSAGIDTDALLEANRIVRANDPKGTANKLNQLAFALEQEGFSIHITVHDTLAGDQLDLVYKRGYADGAAGRTADNSYPENSDLHTQYNLGWRHGTGKNMGLTPKQVDAAIKKGDADDWDVKSPDNLPGQKEAA